MANAVDFTSLVSEADLRKVKTNAGSVLQSYVPTPQPQGFHIGTNAGAAVQVIPPIPALQSGSFSSSQLQIFYFKRSWRNESNDYVYWRTNDINDSYPGGGTLDPPHGVVIYKYF